MSRLADKLWQSAVIINTMHQVQPIEIIQTIKVDACWVRVQFTQIKLKTTIEPIHKHVGPAACYARFQCNNMFNIPFDTDVL